uniref:Uncharacterized protein n=1 Tax=Lactuca sativa TaxID=4236 RepID=A0A9R1WT73_LACSA|nr:hypothetical protein LSAT_V11C100002950 [Lactuca sativa]
MRIHTEMASISSSPRTVEEIFKDYSGCHVGIVRALTHGSKIPREVNEKENSDHPTPNDDNMTMKSCIYCVDPSLASCGVTIVKQLAQVDCHVLEAPKKLFTPIKIEKRVFVNFLASVMQVIFLWELLKCGKNKGNLASVLT